VGEYLKVPKGVVDSMAKVRQLLPSFGSLNHWQQVQYEEMLRLWELQSELESTYKWAQGQDGVLESVQFRGGVLASPNPSNYYTFCTGTGLEHFFSCWPIFMDEEYEGEHDMDLAAAELLIRYWEVHKDEERFWDGAPAGLLMLWEHLQAKWKDWAEKEGVKATFEEEFGFQIVADVDPDEDSVYNAQFGDYIQFQNKPSPIEKDSGHAAIFVGLELRSYKGKQVECVRVFNSNIQNDYGMPKGIGFGWYLLNRKDRGTGHVRQVKWGGLREV